MIVVTTPTEGDPTEVEIIPAVDEQSFGYVIVGADGTAWDLVGGPVTVRAGIRGLGFAEPTHWSDLSAGLDGANYKGMRTGPREVFVPVSVVAPGVDWIGLDSAFASTIAPENECSLVVIAPDSSYRTLAVRYDRGAEGDYDIDPRLAGYAFYDLEFTATDPYWHTPEVTTTIAAPASGGLFPGPPFNIGPASVFGNASTFNPGDKPAWPKWRVNGPCASFSVGVGASTLSVTRTLTAGQWIEADLNPAHRTIVDQAGVDRRDDVTDATFAAIPPGDSDLTVTLAGTTSASSVVLSYTPSYRRAW